MTGWVLPAENLDVLIDAFAKKLLLSYGKVNAEEIEFAFLTGSSEVKDWGKQMNLSLIDEVMIPYLDVRYELSRIEEQQKQKQKILSEQGNPISDEQLEGLWEDVANKVKKGEYNFELIPVFFYEWRDIRGELNIDAHMKSNMLQRIRDYHMNTLHALSTKSQVDAQAFDEFMNMYENGCFTGHVAKKLILLTKKKIVFEMMIAKSLA